MSKEATFLGLVIKDPVWYLVIYPLIFALLFGFFILIQDSIEITETTAGIVSIVLAGFITLIFRSESKK